RAQAIVETRVVDQVRPDDAQGVDDPTLAGSVGVRSASERKSAVATEQADGFDGGNGVVLNLAPYREPVAEPVIDLDQLLAEVEQRAVGEKLGRGGCHIRAGGKRQLAPDVLEVSVCDGVDQVGWNRSHWRRPRRASNCRGRDRGETDRLNHPAL